MSGEIRTRRDKNKIINPKGRNSDGLSVPTETISNIANDNIANENQPQPEHTDYDPFLRRPVGETLKKSHPPFPSGFTPHRTATLVERDGGEIIPMWNMNRVPEDQFRTSVESKYQNEIAAGNVKVVQEPAFELTFCFNCDRLSYCGHDDHERIVCVGCVLASNVDWGVDHQLERDQFITLSDTFHALYYA